MPKCLGIYIEDDVIKYSKVDKERENLKIEAYNVEFYDKNQLPETLEKIIRETFSIKDNISINISNEIYNYFDVFASLSKKDKSKLVDVDFEFFCSERGYNKSSLESRMIYARNIDDPEKQRSIHISTNKENIYKRVSSFGNVKITNVMPVSTSIFNLIDYASKDENIMVVNIENDTKVTIILNDEIYDIAVIPEGMGDILNIINATENDLKRSFESCKNTTIYTQDTQDLQVGENEYLNAIMPILYKIVSRVKEINEDYAGQISKIYITGMGTAINNIDLYFQENFTNIKCELLSPFFVPNSTTSKIPIKEYIEVNSATALALDGLGYGEKDLNFKSKIDSILEMEIDKKDIVNFLKDLFNPNKKMNAFDKAVLRLAVCLGIGVVGYSVFSNSIMNQITDKSAEIDKQSQSLDSQIQTIKTQTSSVMNGKSAYDQMYSALEMVKNPPKSDESDFDDTTIEEHIDAPEKVVSIPKNAIPNLLNRIVYIIPRQVKVTSIKNTKNKHIVIEAQAAKYEQLGYFRAALATSGYLENVKSTSGTKSGGTVVITIEGDLP